MLRSTIGTLAGTGVISSKLLRVLQKHRIVGTWRPKELMETLWLVRDKEALRAWAAAVRMGTDPEEAADDFSRRKEAGHGDHEADGDGR